MNIPERYIFFDAASHKYTDECDNIYTSVTTCIGKYHVPFDSNYWAKYKAIEKGTSEQSIKQEWKNVNNHSVNNGNLKHNVFETAIKDTSKFSKAVNIVRINNIFRCYSVYDLSRYDDIGEMSLESFYNKIGNRYPIIYQTIEYYVKLGYRIYSEINVYDPFNLISGTIDVLLVKGTDFVIIDWKTNRDDIKFEAGYYKKDKPSNELTDIWVPTYKPMLYPIDNLQDCNGIHYSLQLSTYARMVEAFGYTLKAMILFHVRDSFVLNQWGQPRKNEKGIYIVDPTKPEQVDYKIISYLKNDVDKMREHIGRGVTIKTQQKIMMQ